MNLSGLGSILSSQAASCKIHASNGISLLLWPWKESPALL